MYWGLFNKRDALVSYEDSKLFGLDREHRSQLIVCSDPKTF